MECNAGLAPHTWHDIMPLPHCTGSARSCLRKVCEGLASGGGWHEIVPAAVAGLGGWWRCSWQCITIADELHTPQPTLRQTGRRAKLVHSRTLSRTPASCSHGPAAAGGRWLKLDCLPTSSSAAFSARSNNSCRRILPVAVRSRSQRPRAGGCRLQVRGGA